MATAALPAADTSYGDGIQKVNFLLQMARRFEEEGNMVECVKSSETALLLRKALERSQPEQASSAFEVPLLKQAQELVLTCNSVAVEEFQSNHYDTASFLLNKALFLTEEYNETNLFGAAEHDRLRLRAATFNNLGCLEKRRGRLHASLDHLQKAAQLEVSVDPDVGASPSTYLNLCTILNKLGNHVAAVSAAQRAINTLKFQASQGMDQYQNYGVMLAVSYYNLGASLESCDRAGDVAQAVEAYEACLESGRRNQLAPTQTTLLQAAEALRRLQSAQPGALTLPSMRPVFAATGGSTATELVPVPPSRPRSTSASGAPYTLGSFRISGVKPTTPAGVGGASKLTDAALRHSERIQSRQRKKEINAERDQIALQRAQRAHVREKEVKMKREREAEAARREEMAKALYEKMVHGLRAEEIKRVKNAARKIQKIFRGVMARVLIRRMHQAAITIQSGVRSWLCRLRLKRSEEERQVRAAREAQLKRQVHAAVTIQRRVRRFLNRLEIIRSYRARQLRRLCSARRIQRVFRAYCRRREQRVQAQLEAERTADERRLRRQHEAARRIQTMFRAFKMRRITRIVALEQKRRADAAVRIQAIIRGVLTRVWFKHYRLYRRQQELSSTKNLRVIIKIQAAWRRAVAVREKKRRMLQRRYEERQDMLFRSARRIQCAWRCVVAMRTARPLQQKRARRIAAVDQISRVYITYRTRVAFLKRRDAHRQQLAAALIGRWFRERIIINKHKATARYHADILKQRRMALLRTQGAVLLQAYLQARMSSLIVESTRHTYEKQARIAQQIQKAGRGYVSRVDTNVLRGCAARIDEERRVAAQRKQAASVIQRATRCYLAKLKVERMRVRRAASLVISKTYRMHLAKKELRRLRAERRGRLEERAAKSIQRLARKFLRKLELRRLDEYYSEKNRQKLALMRREEAAVSIQAIWRGHATRRETTAERNRLLQNTIDAIRIQRQFRAFRFRTQINQEISRRQLDKKMRRSAAVRIQGFWRFVLAREYVNVLKEQRYNTSVCAIAIQCTWRRYQAKLELDRRRSARIAQNLFRAKQHDVWLDSVNTVAMHLRTRQAQLHRLATLRRSVVKTLTEKERELYLVRGMAATKIQAIYRGYYERTYARGLRRERREKEKAEALLNARRTRAALRLQCFARCIIARRAVRALRFARSEALLAAQMEREAVANPADVVKRLFWSHEAVVKRDLTRERTERHKATHEAAVRMQSCARMFVAMRRFKKHKEEKAKEDAARRIQQQWHEHEEERQKKTQVIAVRAAIKIQAMLRGVLTRRMWQEKQRRLSNRRGSAVRIEDVCDNAAIRIQSAWRMCSAKVRADRLRKRKLDEKTAQLQHESAKLIQKIFRGFRVRKAKKQSSRRLHEPAALAK